MDNLDFVEKGLIDKAIESHKQEIRLIQVVFTFGNFLSQNFFGKPCLVSRWF